MPSPCTVSPPARTCSMKWADSAAATPASLWSAPVRAWLTSAINSSRTSREHRQHAEQPVEQEQHNQEYRRPRRVEEGERAGTRRESQNRLQVGQAGCRPRALRGRHRTYQNRTQHARVKPFLEARADTRQYAPARVVDYPHQQEQERHQGGKRNQRRLRARTQHPVVDLQHEQGPGQHQQVHGDTEQAARHEQPPALCERRPDFPVAVAAFGHRSA